MGDDSNSATGTEGELIDLQKRKMARELEREFAGLFGIDYRDVERALERLQAGAGENQPRMPGPVERTVGLLEVVLEIAREAHDAEDQRSLAGIMELLENYSRRIQKLAEAEPGS